MLPAPAPPRPPSSVHETVSVPDDEEVEFIEHPKTVINGAQDTRAQLNPPPSSKDVPDIVVELEVSFSSKVPMDARLHGFNDIRRAFYGVFMLDPDKEQSWAALDASHLSVSSREIMISAAAKELEFTAMLMCSTQDGYKERLDDTTAMICQEVRALLTGTSVRVEDEGDAGDVIDVMKRLCKSHLKKSGKQRQM